MFFASVFSTCALEGINIGELISSCKTSPVHSAAPHPLALSCGAVARILDRHNEAVVSHERQSGVCSYFCIAPRRANARYSRRCRFPPSNENIGPVQPEPAVAISMKD
ncbi:hypothetical protein F2P81_019388 [Scophthalmus maximus]|uniref:Uncharacterized protein n=1 Tax=Scophthalmus maximus TaxID=52904 RepID=A0A6A4SB36_SCOMX|nr:hypothetical protein F2P81_019388 [Scophthalmus maximus]